MGRPSKPKSGKARNASFSAYPPEISAIKKVARQKKFAAPFDYVRSLVIEDDHPSARGKIREPRRLKTRSSKPDRTPSPNSHPPPPALTA